MRLLPPHASFNMRVSRQDMLRDVREQKHTKTRTARKHAISHFLRCEPPTQAKSRRSDKREQRYMCASDTNHADQHTHLGTNSAPDDRSDTILPKWYRSELVRTSPGEAQKRRYKGQNNNNARATLTFEHEVRVR